MNPTEDLPTLCNCARFRRASRTITRFYDNCLAPSGLGVNQFTLLGYLNSRGPMPMNRLAELLAMDRATIGHNVRPLERDGRGSSLGFVCRTAGHVPERARRGRAA